MSFLPPSTNDQYRGARASAWFLGLVAVLTLIPGLIHSFLPDGGAQVIAGLDMGNRRALVIGTFRWEGATQLAFGFAMLAVAVRYRPLTPLFLALVILERGLMALQGWVIAPPADGRHLPEHYGSLAAAPPALIFLILALRQR
jgi:hypothetical protein